jgi:hypothetical protein
MSAVTTVSLPAELLREVAQQAEHTGMPIQEWVAQVLAERVRLERQTEEFFAIRAARASGKKLGELLDKAPNRPPDPGDEFEQ